MRFILLLCLLIAFTSQAQGARLSLVGVANSTSPNSPGVEYSSETSYGVGVLLESRLVPMFGFEIGAIYAPRKYSLATAVPNATNVTNTGKMFEFPAAFRFHLGRNFSLGFGGYYAIAKGEVQQETTSAAGASKQSVSYASQNQTESDFGLLGSIQASFRITPLTHLVFDARYLMGLKNNSTVAGGDRKYNDLELLAGLQLGF
jgi:hypothetical protein